MAIDDPKVRIPRHSSYFIPELTKVSFRLAEINKTWLSLDLGPEGKCHEFEVHFYEIKSPRNRYTIFLHGIVNYQEILAIVPESKRAEFRREITRNIEHIVGVSSYSIKNKASVLNSEGSL